MTLSPEEKVQMARVTLRSLAELDVMSICREPKCTQPVTPSGDPFLFGHDHNGDPVYMQRFVCAAGHRYHEERTL